MASGKKKQTRANQKPQKNQKPQNYVRDEIIILVSLALCLLITISHFGIGGYVGEAVSGFLFGIFGVMAYLIQIVVFIGIAFVISNKGNSKAYIKTGTYALLYLLCCTIFQLIIYGYVTDGTTKAFYQSSRLHHDGGGVLGGWIVNALCPAIGVVGTWVVVILLFVICFILLTGKSVVGAVKEKSERAYQSAKEDVQRRKEEGQLKRADRVVSGVSFDTTLEKPDADKNVDKKGATGKAVGQPEQLTLDGVFGAAIQGGGKTSAEAPATTGRTTAVPAIEKPSFKISGNTPLSGTEDFEPEADVDEENERPAITRRRRSTKESRESSAAEAENVQQVIEASNEEPKKKYEFPPMSLLARGTNSGGDSESHLRETAMKLQQTLQTFGVNATVTNVSCGPSVTRYELQPEQGVKVSKIVGLADDIKLNLAASDIRIEAPIPGKAAVGIEVPNKENSIVRLRDLLETPEFKNHKSKIAFAAARDIGGNVVVADIAKMPHVLVAGATGSGKSVCINTLIISILYKATPEEVRFIMIDPKVVELNVYNDIPHLLIPVVTDPKKAAGALNWAVAEMTRRYQLFAECHVRDIKGYNEKVESLLVEGIPDAPEKLPQIVIIVDELADLMMVAAKEVEDAICRLAQLARACGIHLVLATQRPSVNVITGLIKANMPSRIAFAVSSGVDSRTIIDMNGAEKLLGKGDMLFYPTGYPKPVRAQGAFVDDEEVQKVVRFLTRSGQGASYNEEITKHMNSASVSGGASGSEGGGDDRDDLFVPAGKLIVEQDRASIGMLQRKFKIGFNRAARIMDQLCEAGVVGEDEGTKPRKVLMSMEEFDQYVDEYV